MQALVVDDSAIIRKILTAYLQRFGFTVTVAEDGRQALDRLSTMATSDLVLVDWNMPEMDGIAFIRAVRAQAHYAALPLIMVTTNADISHVAEALDAGANEYIMKPFTADIMREKLELLGFAV
jgi:two-component system chemotaxis response regulator CheY